jgi:hypothetical protein
MLREPDFATAVLPVAAPGSALAAAFSNAMLSVPPPQAVGLFTQ